MRYLSSVCVIAFMLGVSAMAAAEILVIGHPATEMRVTEKEQLADLYLGKRDELSGQRVRVLDHSEGGSVRQRFYQQVTGRSLSQLNAYWSKLIFTGKGMPPEQVGEDFDVIGLVQDDPSAVGYIDADSLSGERVKVLFRIP